MGEFAKEEINHVAEYIIKELGLDNLNNRYELLDDSERNINTTLLISNSSTHDGKIKMKRHRSKKWRNGIKSKKK